MTADDCDIAFLRLSTSDAGKEARSTNDVEGGDTEDAAGVVDTSLLEDLGDDGDSGVDGVRDDEEMCLRCNARDGSGEVADDRRVGLVQIISLAIPDTSLAELTLKRSSRVI